MIKKSKIHSRLKTGDRPVLKNKRKIFKIQSLISVADNIKNKRPVVVSQSHFFDIPGFKSYKILLNKFENPFTHSSQDLMEILDTILQNKLKFSFILLMILVFYNIVLISF
jgi:hypothetical protein